MDLNCISLTPGFSRVNEVGEDHKTVLTVSSRDRKPLKRFQFTPAHNTRLKPGVNENGVGNAPI